MGKTNRERRKSAWLTVRQLADALDVTEGFVRREVLRRVPDDMVRRDCRPMMVYGRGAIEAWLGSPAAGPVEQGGDALAEDLLLSLLVDGMS